MSIQLVVTKIYQGQRATLWWQPATQTNRDPNRRQKVMRLYKKWHRPIISNSSSNLFTPYREQPRSTRIDVAYLPAFSATNWTNCAPTSFDPQVIKVSQGPDHLTAVTRHRLKRWSFPGYRRSTTGKIVWSSHCIYMLLRRYFQHAHFIPIVGVGKRGEY